MALTHDMRRALAERVQRRVEGRGTPRHVIEDARARVGDALERSPSVSTGSAPQTPIAAAFAARVAPDLGSRIRASVQAGSVSSLGIAISTAGRHTFATVRLAADAPAAAEGVAAKVAAIASFGPDLSPTSSQ